MNSFAVCACPKASAGALYLPGLLAAQLGYPSC